MTHDPVVPGIITPLVTFVDGGGDPDRAAMARLVEHQVEAGVHGLLAAGSTGELGNLTPAQRIRTTEVVAEAVAGRVPVWAGVAGLGTTDTVLAARDAAAAGADALLVLPPLFFDVSDDELVRHFSAVADAVDIPLVAYDVPPRTPRKIPVGVLVALGLSGALRGVKDSSGDLTAGRLAVAATAGIPGFRVYVGSEITMDAAFVLGFHGIVPGFANVMPAPAVRLHDAWSRGDLEAARGEQAAYLELFRILAVPLPGAGGPAAAVNAIKVATAAVLGLPLPAISEPLTQPTAQFAAAIAAVLDAATAVPVSRG